MGQADVTHLYPIAEAAPKGNIFAPRPSGSVSMEANALLQRRLQKC